MKVVIAGSRTLCDNMERKLQDYISLDVAIRKAISADICPSVVVCGGAKGVDMAGAAWGISMGLKVENFPADWKTHGMAAGHIRNHAMAKASDAAIILWDGESRGAANMIKQSQKEKIPHVIHTPSWNDLEGYTVFDAEGVEIGTFGKVYGDNDYGIELTTPDITGKTIVPTHTLPKFFSRKVRAFAFNEESGDG